jgi:cardiolipin synthase
MMGIVNWFRLEFVPWTRGRMFRTGVPFDQPVTVTTRVATVANGITLIRLLGLPVFVYLAAVRHSWLIAFALFGLLAVLDSMDGYVARRFNQSTKLGSALDPLTDRLTILTLSITLVVVGVIPLWVVALVALRDVLLLALVAVFSKLGLPTPVRRIPVTRVGKLATMALLAGLPFLLLARVSLPGGFVIHICGLVLTGSGIALYYIALWQYLRAGISNQEAAIAQPQDS